MHVRHLILSPWTIYIAPMDKQSSDTSVEIVRDEEGFLCLRGSSARLQADGTVLLRCGDESHRDGRIFDKIDAESCHDIVLACLL